MDINQRLEQAFEFSQAELEANRALQLSAAQKSKLAEYRPARGCGRRAAAIACGFTAVAMVALAFLLDAPGIDQARPFLLLVAGVLAALF